MKTFKQFLEESINISGDFNGTLIVGGNNQPEPQTEEFSADIVYMGNIHRISMVTETNIPSRNELTEYLQNKYPGGVVHQIYTSESQESNLKITDSKRYHPAKLDWV